MKKIGILNQHVAAVVAAMGHYDRLVLSDAGFPVPPGVPCIDLVIGEDEPGIFRVLDMVMEELEVEEMILHEEVAQGSPERRGNFVDAVPGAAVRDVDRSTFFELANEAKAVVRTGERVPYSNVILISGTTY